MSAPGLTGACFVDGKVMQGGGATFQATDPSNGGTIGPAFADATMAVVARACEAAAAAEDEYAATSKTQRAQFLRRIASELDGLGDELLTRCHRETALPMARIASERARTKFQLECFANAVEEGSWVDARIDRADPKRQPLPKPDLRAMLAAIGPVAVFGASNFPLAYSVAGGDTASALAAGCPVVVKAHPMHPGTSELVASAILAAARACQLPLGVFSMVHGKSHEVGRALVESSAINAVGFTGSQKGGAALCRIAAARERPIPVFAEMGSVNPVFVLPLAMAQRGPAIAQAIVNSALLACGQFCTSPGMTLFCDGPDAEPFVRTLVAGVASSAPGTLVHPDICANYERAQREIAAVPGVSLLAESSGPAACEATGGRARLFVVDAESVLRTPSLREEIYGPASLLVRCKNAAAMQRVAESMSGHLTATVHGDDGDLREHAGLLRALRKCVGRIVHNGVPTGVEVCAAMQHGGPWPASSDSRFTAVGLRAMLRWARSVAWQDAPQAALPPELADGNPLGIWRTIDGLLGRA